MTYLLDIAEMDYRKMLALEFHQDMAFYDKAKELGVYILPNEYGFRIYGPDKARELFNEFFMDAVRKRRGPQPKNKI